MTSTAEQITNLQSHLGQSRVHTAQLVTNLEGVRNEASGAVTELVARLLIYISKWLAVDVTPTTPRRSTS